GTISSPNAATMYFDGHLSAFDKKLIFSVCRNSNHPLSREIMKWVGDGEILTIEGYEEVVGKGQSARYGDYHIQIGSASFVGIQQANVEGSTVYIKINGEIKGSFTLEQPWRKGLNEVVIGLTKRDYELHLISGDNERRV